MTTAAAVTAPGSDARRLSTHAIRRLLQHSAIAEKTEPFGKPENQSWTSGAAPHAPMLIWASACCSASRRRSIAARTSALAAGAAGTGCARSRRATCRHMRCISSCAETGPHSFLQPGQLAAAGHAHTTGPISSTQLVCRARGVGTLVTLFITHAITSPALAAGAKRAWSTMMAVTPSSSSHCAAAAPQGAGTFGRCALKLPSRQSARGVPADPADDASRLHHILQTSWGMTLTRYLQ